METNTNATARRFSFRRPVTALAVAGIAGATVLATAPAALARHGGDAVRANGGCDGGTAVWKLKGKTEDAGLIEVEYEVDSNVVGQEWQVRLTDNGDRFFRGTRTTGGASGSFTVHKNANDQAGSDVIRARAVNGEQVCRGHITV
jgi:hypothetical protein